MSEILAEQLTAMATVVLAVFAIVTAVLAGLAFLKQSREVRAVERQVADGQEVAQQQAGLLRVQTGQLEVLTAQLEDQRKASTAQAEVLGLQAAELRESLKERDRSADDRKRRQATGVVAWIEKSRDSGDLFAGWGARIRNATDLPIFNVRVFFHLISRQDGSDWVPVSIGGPPPDETAPVVPPTADRFVPIPAKIVPMFGSIEISDRSCLVSFEFTDASGNRWERDPRGALNPLT